MANTDRTSEASKSMSEELTESLQDVSLDDGLPNEPPGFDVKHSADTVQGEVIQKADDQSSNTPPTSVAVGKSTPPSTGLAVPAQNPGRSASIGSSEDLWSSTHDMEDPGLSRSIAGSDDLWPPTHDTEMPHQPTSQDASQAGGSATTYDPSASQTSSQFPPRPDEATNRLLAQKDEFVKELRTYSGGAHPLQTITKSNENATEPLPRATFEAYKSSTDHDLTELSLLALAAEDARSDLQDQLTSQPSRARSPLPSVRPLESSMAASFSERAPSQARLNERNSDRGHDQGEDKPPPPADDSDSDGLAEAEELIQEILALHAEVNLQRALQALEKRKWEEAHGITIEALHLAQKAGRPPLEGKCHFWKGTAEYRLHNYKDALESFKAAEPCRDVYWEGSHIDKCIKHLQKTFKRLFGDSESQSPKASVEPPK